MTPLNEKKHHLNTKIVQSNRLTVSCNVDLFFFLRLGGATGALFKFVWDVCVVFNLFCTIDGFVLAITSGSCNVGHVLSCCVPVDIVNVLGYCFELCVDSESNELDDNADTEAVFFDVSVPAKRFYCKWL